MTNTNRSARFHEARYLLLLSGVCLLLSFFRIQYTHSHAFIFLNWNLFLAVIPWILSSALVLHESWRRNKLLVVATLCSWLVFFPNAPYILTDLFHLSEGAAMPIWFDLVLILSFAWTGLLAGFLSLWDIEQVLRQHIAKRYIPFISIGLLFISSFGIYLGRYLRWNTWDILHHPNGLIRDISSRFIHPFDHPRTWGVTMFTGLFLSIVYVSFRMIRQREVRS
jgi:uncharacterized membrane protein